MTPVSDTVSTRGWYYGWNIVVACVLAQVAANALPINAFSLFLHDWSVDLHTPISSLQLGIAACGLFSALLSPVVGGLADKQPARLLLGGGVAAMAVFCLAISFVGATWQYVALYALLLPAALVLSTSIPANAVVSRWFERRRGLALGLTAFGLGIAGVVMPPIVAAVMPLLGWRMIWRIGAAVIALVILPLVLGVVRDRPQARHGRRYLGGAAAPALHGAPAGGGIGWRDVFGRRNFWLFVAGYVPMLGLYGGCGQNLVPLAVSRGLSPETAGVLLSSFSLAQLVATLGGGVLSDRFGNRLPFAGLAFATTLGGVALALGHNLFVITLGAALAGFGGGFWPLLASGLAVEFGPAGVGRAFGLVAFFVPGAILAPFVVAKAQESSGSYTPGLLALSLLTLLGGCAALLIRERRAAGASAGSDAAEVTL